MRFLVTVLHFTWCLPQTVAGALLRARYRRCPQWSFRTSVVTEWPRDAGLSLGRCVFVPAERQGRYEQPGPARRLLVHEYGHSIQSLLLGPLYLPLVVLPSSIWANSKRAYRYRQTHHISYYSVYPENWANALGTKVTGEPTPW